MHEWQSPQPRPPAYSPQLDQLRGSVPATKCDLQPQTSKRLRVWEGRARQRESGGESSVSESSRGEGRKRRERTEECGSEGRVFGSAGLRFRGIPVSLHTFQLP
ncbi:unnamed protein product [Pleuronectes platessa]|uniref:Uncharacterized protein n=1 Tax=Pleuronectes platessa TaxID=8262 RepID=A0A9N7W0I1_PLEPL|nr:unnamed protein product [Pleuronectes platessa]